MCDTVLLLDKFELLPVLLLGVIGGLLGSTVCLPLMTMCCCLLLTCR